MNQTFPLPKQGGGRDGKEVKIDVAPKSETFQITVSWVPVGGVVDPGERAVVSQNMMTSFL